MFGKATAQPAHTPSQKELLDYCRRMERLLGRQSNSSSTSKLESTRARLRARRPS